MTSKRACNLVPVYYCKLISLSRNREVIRTTTVVLREKELNMVETTVNLRCIGTNWNVSWRYLSKYNTPENLDLCIKT